MVYIDTWKDFLEAAQEVRAHATVAHEPLRGREC